MAAAARRAVDRHYHKNPYRYAAMHFDLNRAQRRSEAKRDARGKLLTRHGNNVPFVHQDPIKEPTDA